MQRISLSLFLVLVAFWLVNSGHFSALILLLGLASILLVIVLSDKLSVIDRESLPLYLAPKIVGYWLWLIKEIVQANIAVLKHIFSTSHSISPRLELIKISQTTAMGKVIYANSITLTPGTVVVELIEDTVLVHALDAKSIEGLELGAMDARVRLLEDQ